MEMLEKCNIVIKNKELLDTALSHSSYAYEKGGESYERLEYLGDAVLEIVCSEYLYKNTNYSEGRMSELRKYYVCENALYEYSSEFNLASYIKHGNGIKEPNKSIIADVFEAIIAVVYLECGLDKVKDLFNTIIVPHIKSKEDYLMDYKTLLQEDVQTVKKSIEYKKISETGPAHDREFTVEVIIDGLVYGVGVGKTKKEAEQNAAKEALSKKA